MDNSNSAVTFGSTYAEARGISTQAYETARDLDIPQPGAQRGMLDAALWWRHVGAIFPLMEASRGRNPGKTPHDMLGHGYTADTVASRNVERIQEWWTYAPMANVGIVTRPNGLLILDVDGRHGGWDGLKALCAREGIALDSVPRSRSPRGDGGAHLWFRVPDGLTYTHSPLVRGVDRPWQVPVPPSLRYVIVDPDERNTKRAHDYRPYTWEAGSPLDLPVAPEVLLRDPQPGTAGASEMQGTSVSLDFALWVQHGVPPGEQNFAFFKLACSMCNRGVPIEEAYEVVWETAQRSKLGDESDPWTYDQVCRHVYNAYRRIGGEIEQRDRTNRAVVQGILENLA